MFTTLLILISLSAIAIWWTYPRLGLWLYKHANKIEAKLYGLKNDVADLGELHMAYLSNEQPEKPVLVLIHGFSADKAVWLRFARRLSQDYQLIIPDLAGHGETGFRKEWDYTIEAQAKRIVALLGKLNVSSAHIVGNSMGGFIAAHMGRFNADIVDSIVLIDPAGVKAPQQSKMDKMLAQGVNPFYIDNRQQFYQFFAMTMQKPPYLPQITKDALAEYYQARKPQLKQIFQAFNLPEGKLDNEVENIQVPALILWGEQDDILHVSAAQNWQKIRQHQLVVWPDLGHMPMLEDPKRTEQALRGFLATT